MKGDRRDRLAYTLALSVCMMAAASRVGTVGLLPDRMLLHPGVTADLPVSMAVSAGVDTPGNVIANLERNGSGGGLRLTAGEAGETSVTFKLLGVLPVASMDVSVQERRVLVPGGQSVGVAINAGGLVVVGSSDLGNTPSPARLAGLKTGDVITRVDGRPVGSAEQFAAMIGDDAADIELERDGETLRMDVQPAVDSRDGAYRLGVWVRDSTAGVGTLTFYDPQSRDFGALGHAITDVDTGVLMPVGEGAIYENAVVEVTPGVEGAPGELTGDFFLTGNAIGSVDVNSDCGIFGTSDRAFENSLYPEGLPVAARSEVRPGPATLLTTLADGALREYECEITRINPHSVENTRSMVVRITDPELIEKTGGIVQGMSGSPIIQDGKLVGAVTHVLVNSPDTGYGIFIENMLDAAS